MPKSLVEPPFYRTHHFNDDVDCEGRVGMARKQTACSGQILPSRQSTLCVSRWLGKTNTLHRPFRHLELSQHEGLRVFGHGWHLGSLSEFPGS